LVSLLLSNKPDLNGRQIKQVNAEVFVLCPQRN